MSKYPFEDLPPSASVPRDLGDVESDVHVWATSPVEEDLTLSFDSCSCGHAGLGIAWHAMSCPWAGAAARRKLMELARWCDGDSS
jgi:hypothetical protein